MAGHPDRLLFAGEGSWDISQVPVSEKVTEKEKEKGLHTLIPLLDSISNLFRTA